MVNAPPTYELPDFLAIPHRPSKPRTHGITHVIDKGCTLDTAQALMGSVGGLIDVWKFGWGTSYLDPGLLAKVQLLHDHHITPCFGGTLLEISWLQDRVHAYFDFATRCGLSCVEVSNGATRMPAATKRSLIALAVERGFDVISEVGSKDPRHHAQPSQWVDEVTADIDAGANWVVAEGRESGTVGLYHADGSVQVDLVEALHSSTHGDRVIYEAPRRTQQAWLLLKHGPNTNLGNIALDEVIGLETLRLGLRADTIGIAAPWTGS
jgi:phosphosulfolactate synthase